MRVNVLFAGGPDRWPVYQTPLENALSAAGVDARLATSMPPEEVDYIVYAPDSPLQDFTPYTRARAVLNLWAGVEKIVGNQTLRIPLARMVDPGLTQGMIEWVTAHVLRHHLEIDRDIVNLPKTWTPRATTLAPDRDVVIFGLGALGQAVARALLGLGFKVTGWSRSPKSVDGICSLHGVQGFEKALERAEIAVTLLPDTPATTNIIDAEALARMPKGACIINPGRGPLIDDDALISALDRGQIAHATLDVFRIEPLPADHPFWHHPSVTVTPHIAADTRAGTAAQVVAENIRRGEAGEAFLHLVDRQLGY